MINRYILLVGVIVALSAIMLTKTPACLLCLLKDGYADRLLLLTL